LLSHIPFSTLCFPFSLWRLWLALVSLGEETVQVLLMVYRLVDSAIAVDLFVSREKWWLANALAV
jgi:hypothetical protein